MEQILPCCYFSFIISPSHQDKVIWLQNTVQLCHYRKAHAIEPPECNNCKHYKPIDATPEELESYTTMHRLRVGKLLQYGEFTAEELVNLINQKLKAENQEQK